MQAVKCNQFTSHMVVIVDGTRWLLFDKQSTSWKSLLVERVNYT
jgi:hypothetical protein